MFNHLSVPLHVYGTSVDALSSTPAPPASLPATNPTKSFWLDPEDNPLAKEGSTGPLASDEVDICIIGSGITGISTLWHLVNGLKSRTKNTTIMVLEARDFCESRKYFN
ncbi:hypothetical protein PM082_000476 [Marasmius tenuissimus]|nr:hypothetical protein PM082_000476 [Marasmius tenuissimus]